MNFKNKLMLNLKCEKCLVNYEKPDLFKVWNDRHPNIFYNWSLRFCDFCRKHKESKALEALPKVIQTLSNEDYDDITNDDDYKK